jgi:hypothetical protein
MSLSLCIDSLPLNVTELLDFFQKTAKCPYCPRAYPKFSNQRCNPAGLSLASLNSHENAASNSTEVTTAYASSYDSIK